MPDRYRECKADRLESDAGFLWLIGRNERRVVVPAEVVVIIVCRKSSDETVMMWIKPCPTII